jgi:peptidoglycan/xylan/chitin deacetylase (PgdA/CDA1 family)
MNGADLINICFHGIGTPRRELEPGEDGYWIAADRYLRILDEIATWPSARISFDDGNASDVEIALPALEQQGLTARFFVLAGRLGSPGSLAGADVRDLASRGMTVGSHGMSHRSWRGMDQATRQAELVEARHRIEDASGCIVTEVACPLGRYDRRVLAELRELGYERVYTSDRRTSAHGRWLQPRFSVHCDDTPESLRATVLRKQGPGRRSGESLVGLAKRLR